jgi:hypothetical protein
MENNFEPPEHLSERAKEIFNQYVPKPFKALLQINELVLFLEDLDMREEIKKAIDKAGLLTETAAGKPKLNPLVRELRKINSQLIARSRYLKLNQDFNFDPYGDFYPFCNQ